MTKKNLELATKIVEKHVEKHPVAGTYCADLLPLLGMALGSGEAKKGKAVEDMANQLAAELDAGNITLAPGWAKTNGFAD